MPGLENRAIAVHLATEGGHRIPTNARKCITLLPATRVRNHLPPPAHYAHADPRTIWPKGGLGRPSTGSTCKTLAFEDEACTGNQPERSMRGRDVSRIMSETSKRRNRMACYPCTHCNKCGMYSARAAVLCAACETPIPVGAPRCPNCGGKAFKTVRLPDDPSIVNFVRKPDG